MKLKKIFVVIFISIFIFIILINFNNNFNKLSGNIYSNQNNIMNNIKIGDKVNYSANGYSNWEVLSVNKNKKTIEIVSVDEVERLTLEGYDGWKNSKEKILEISNKYKEGINAIDTRILNKNDLEKNITKNGCFWLEDTEVEMNNSYSLYYYCETNSELDSVPLIYANTSYVNMLIVISLYDTNANNYNIGENYEYSSQGIKNWNVLSIDSKDTISIIPKITPKINLAIDDNIKNGNEFLNNYLKKYYDNDKVKNVRLISSNDENNLIKAGFTNNNGIRYITGYIGLKDSNYSEYNYGNGYYSYQFTSMTYLDSKKKYIDDTLTYEIYSIEYGVRPVISLDFYEELIKN